VVEAGEGFARRTAVDEDARCGVVREGVAEAGVGVVGDGAEGREDDRAGERGRAVFANAVGDDGGDAAAAHFDLVLVCGAARDVPGDAAIGIDVPAGLCRERAGEQCERGDSSKEGRHVVSTYLYTT
jgi:hypothetical protein